jgi:TRAP-type mannitol/chloroaromatic compound transport system permease large subunit
VNPITAWILGSALLVFLLFLGMPIAFVMMFVEFLGISYLASINTAFYEVASYYPYTIIPLFILMGGFAGSAGITKELYQTFDKWFRKLPGGLGIETIGSCAGFAALSGSSVAGAAAMGRVALFLLGMMGC